MRGDDVGDRAGVDRRTKGPAPADLLALAVAYFTVGVTVSVAVTDIGTPAWLTLVVAVTAYSATGELAFVAVIVGGGSLAAALVSGWLVSTRFGLLAVSLGGRLRASTAERALAAVTVVDPSVALALAAPDPAGVRRIYWRVTGVLVAGFLVGTVVGVVLGNVIGDPRTWGLDAVFPAALLATVARLLARRDGAVAAALGAALCLLLIPHAPGGVPIIAALAGSLVALSVPARGWRST